MVCVLRLSGVCLEGVWRYLVGVWGVSGRWLDGVWRVSEGWIDGVWGISWGHLGGHLDDILGI